MSKIIQLTVCSGVIYGLDDNGVLYRLERNSSWTKWVKKLDSSSLPDNTPQGRETI